MTLSQSIPGRRALLSFAALFLLAAAVAWLRCLNAYTWPILHAEDGPNMLAFYYNERCLDGVLRVYSGYVSLLPNLVGYLAGALPLRLASQAMSAYTLVLAATAHALFAHHHFRALIAEDRARNCICIVLILVPAGNYAIYSSTTYSIWHLLWILILLVAAPAPRRPLARLVGFVVGALAAWSHPLSIVCVPIGITRLFVKAPISERVYHGGIVAAILSYVAMGIELDFAGGARPRMPDLAASMELLLQRVPFEAFAGNHLRLLLLSQGMGWVVTVLGALLIMALFALILTSPRPNWSRQAVAVSYLVIALTMLAIGARGEALLSGPWEHRYFYLQQLLVLSLATVAAYTWCAASRAPRRSAAVAGVTALVVIGVLQAQNGMYFDTDRKAGRSMLDSLSLAEERLSQSTRPVVLPRKGGWDIRLNPQARAANCGE